MALLGKRDGFALSKGMASPSLQRTSSAPHKLRILPLKTQSTMLLQSVVILEATGITTILLFL